jgi:hypothetical protein
MAELAVEAPTAPPLSYEEHVRAAVDSIPPLTPDQRAYISALLSPAPAAVVRASA